MHLFSRFKHWLWPSTMSDEEKLYLQLVNHGCPDCGNTEFEEGPSASVATNIRCSDPECHSEFNIAPMLRFAERIRHVPKG